MKMKTIEIGPGLNMVDPEFYEGPTPPPFWERNGKCMVFADGLQASTFPESEGWYYLTHNAKHGGIQLTTRNLRTLEARIVRILSGKKEPLRVELQGFGDVDFNIGHGELWGNVWSGGAVIYRLVIRATLVEFLAKIHEALSLIANETNVSSPEPEIEVSTGSEPKNSANGITWK